MSTFTPAVTLHVAAALAALVLGPLALWARRRGGERPWLWKHMPR